MVITRWCGRGVSSELPKLKHENIDMTFFATFATILCILEGVLRTRQFLLSCYVNSVLKENSEA